MNKITFEFDYYKDKEEIQTIHNVHKFVYALDEIYDIVWNELKHGEEELSDHINQLLERIKVEASIVFDI